MNIKPVLTPEKEEPHRMTKLLNDLEKVQKLLKQFSGDNPQEQLEAVLGALFFMDDEDDTDILADLIIYLVDNLASASPYK